MPDYPHQDLPTAPANASSIQLLDATIAQLNSCLGLKPGQTTGGGGPTQQQEKSVYGRKTTGSRPKNKGADKNKRTSQSKGTSGVAVAGQPEGTMIDLRVGEIKKVWRHETADKLYCEEIDVGEAEPRQIASGLVPHYSLEEMTGRRVVVMCNLKPRSLKGFKSQGMVVCAAGLKDNASSGDGKVELVEPPEGARVGEMLSFGNVEEGPFAPVSAAQMEKKKILDAVLPEFVTDGDGAVKWRNHPLLSSAGPCLAPTVRNGMVR